VNKRDFVYWDSVCAALETAPDSLRPWFCQHPDLPIRPRRQTPVRPIQARGAENRHVSELYGVAPLLRPRLHLVKCTVWAIGLDDDNAARMITRRLARPDRHSGLIEVSREKHATTPLRAFRPTDRPTQKFRACKRQASCGPGRESFARSGCAVSGGGRSTRRIFGDSVLYGGDHHRRSLANRRLYLQAPTPAMESRNGGDDRAAAIDRPFAERAVGGSTSMALFCRFWAVRAQ
jgi:hypothetical protein